MRCMYDILLWSMKGVLFWVILCVYVFGFYIIVLNEFCFDVFLKWKFS